VVVDALAQTLVDRGVPIFVRSPVETVSIGSADGPALRIAGNAAEADAVVATVGLPIIRRILPAEQRGFTHELAATDYVGACVVLMEIQQKLSKFYWTNISDPDMPFAGLIEHTNMVSRERYGGQRLMYVTNYLPPEHEFFSLGDDALVERFVDPIRRVFPRFEREHIGRVWVSRDPVAQPVIGAGYQRRKPAYRSPIPGFYICNTSQIYPEDRGTNYNVRIARECLEVLEADARDLTGTPS
jgi:protoporphyrinogen oxidase